MATAPLTRMAVVLHLCLARSFAAEEISTCSGAEPDEGGNCPGESDGLESSSLLQSRTTLSRNIASPAGEAQKPVSLRQRLFWSTFKTSMAVKSQPKSKSNLWQMKQNASSNENGSQPHYSYDYYGYGGDHHDAHGDHHDDHGDHHDGHGGYHYDYADHHDGHADHHNNPCPECGEPSDPASCFALCSSSCGSLNETCLACAMENNCMACHDCVVSNQHDYSYDYYGHGGDHHNAHGDHHDDHGDHHDDHADHHDNPCPECGEPTDPASCIALCSDSCTNNDETCVACVMKNNCTACYDCMVQHADDHDGHGDHHDYGGGGDHYDYYGYYYDYYGYGGDHHDAHGDHHDSHGNHHDGHHPQHLLQPAPVTAAPTAPVAK